ACGGCWRQEKHRRARLTILRRLVTGKAPSGTPNYSATVGGCLWVWLCVSRQLATGKASSGSPDYSTEVGGFGFSSWIWLESGCCQL
ncbi:hypothetical protein A2U01_0069328, partial [Trifolium medium]|nr:hypothetical protein [Trifolium medium]